MASWCNIRCFLLNVQTKAIVYYTFKVVFSDTQLVYSQKATALAWIHAKSNIFLPNQPTPLTDPLDSKTYPSLLAGSVPDSSWSLEKNHRFLLIFIEDKIVPDSDLTDPSRFAPRKFVEKYLPNLFSTTGPKVGPGRFPPLVTQVCAWSIFTLTNRLFKLFWEANTSLIEATDIIDSILHASWPSPKANPE